MRTLFLSRRPLSRLPLSGLTSSRRRATRGHAGFSLIEMLVALACASIVLTSAMAAVVHAGKATQRGRAERSLIREAEFFSVILHRAIERGGVGVPSSTHLDDGSPDPPRAIILAQPTVVGVLGDFPRPHAQYATIGTLHSRHGNGKRRLTFHTESNGSCVPNTAAPTCAISDASLFFPGDATACVATGDFYNRTCPWGLRRVAPTDHIQIIGGTGGQWTTGQLGNTAATASVQNTVSGRTFLTLQLAADYADSANDWPNAADGDAPTSVPGHNLLVTLDRVFFDYDAANRELERIQCWGHPDTDAAWYPADGATAVPTPVSDNGSGRFCTPREVVLRDVEAVAFTYRQANGTVTAVEEDIRRVDYTIEVRRDVLGQPVRYVVTGSAAVMRAQD